MGQFVYHLKPANLEGVVLFPLNRLRELNPVLYDLHAKKYLGREAIMNKPVLHLNVLWNDVLHFSPVSPSLVFEALMKIHGARNTRREFYKIPIEALDESRCVYFAPSDRSETMRDQSFADEFTEFKTKDYVEQKHIGLEQIQKWQKDLENQTPPLLFSRTRHLLYHGELDISGFEIVHAEA